MKNKHQEFLLIKLHRLGPSTTNCHLVPDLALQELRRWFSSVTCIRKVRRRNGQSASADEITQSAVNLQILGRIILDTTVVLPVLCVSKKHRSNHPIPQTSIELGNSASDNSSTLTVASRHDGRAGTFGVGEFKETDCFVDGSR